MQERYKPHTYPGESVRAREILLSDSEGSPDSTGTENILAEGFTEDSENSDVRFVRETISLVDEPKLEEIFRHIVIKAGRDEHDTNFRSFGDTQVRPLERGLGFYDTDSNVIHINSQLEKQIEKYDKIGEHLRIDIETYKKLRILYTYIHEQTHAVGHNSLNISVTAETLDVKSESGVSRGQLTLETTLDGNLKVKNSQLAKQMNEGITEIIAEHTLRAYVHQYPLANISQTDVEKFLKSQKMLSVNAYARNIFVTKLYGEVLAKATGIPYEVVEQGFIRSYLRGTEVISPEEEEIVDALLGEHMGYLLREAINADDTKEFEKIIELSDVRADPGTYVHLLSDLIGDTE